MSPRLVPLNQSAIRGLVPIQEGSIIGTLDAIANREPWQAEALCAKSDPEEWFPDRGQFADEAKKICRRCPVRQECLDYALRNKERFGVWGGFTELERRRLKIGVVA